MKWSGFILITLNPGSLPEHAPHPWYSTVGGVGRTQPTMGTALTDRSADTSMHVKILKPG